MSDEKLAATDEVRRAFINALNRHGYGFQQAVAELVTKLPLTRGTTWAVETTEFPVEVERAVTSIDLIPQDGQTDTYLVCECKRVDPALGRWCFARTLARGRDTRLNRVILEQLVFSSDTKLQSKPLEKPRRAEPFTIGVEVRTDAKGDGVGGSKDAIELSVGQVLRGASGLANYYHSRDWAELGGRSFRFVPAVITTADLWVTDADLTNTDLVTGKVTEEQFRTKPVDWLWYNYNLSPHLRHSIPGTDTTLKSLADVLIAESTRSVAVVNPRGLAEFLVNELGEFL